MAGITVKVGHLRQVVPSALAFSFELLAEGTVAEGARLELESVPAEGVCRECGARSRLESFPLLCGRCGSVSLEIVAGEELLVESLDLEDPEEARDGRASSRLEGGSGAGGAGRE